MDDIEEKIINTTPPIADDSGNDYAEFEIGKHRVPWFLWLFFLIIISWASISWIKFFGY
jgi:hypothetical protein